MNRIPLYRFARQLAYVRLGMLRRKMAGDTYADMSYRTIQVTIRSFILTMYVGASEIERESIRTAFRSARADYESIEGSQG